MAMVPGPRLESKGPIQPRSERERVKLKHATAPRCSTSARDLAPEAGVLGTRHTGECDGDGAGGGVNIMRSTPTPNKHKQSAFEHIAPPRGPTQSPPENATAMTPGAGSASNEQIHPPGKHEQTTFKHANNLLAQSSGTPTATASSGGRARSSSGA